MLVEFWLTRYNKLAQVMYWLQEMNYYYIKSSAVPPVGRRPVKILIRALCLFFTVESYYTDNGWRESSLLESVHQCFLVTYVSISGFNPVFTLNSNHSIMQCFQFLPAAMA